MNLGLWISPHFIYIQHEHLQLLEIRCRCKVIITLRDPIELMLSMHQEHSKRLVDYNSSQSEMLAAAAACDYQANPEDPKLLSFLAFPRLKNPTLDWIEAGGAEANRIRIVPLSSIKNDSLATINSILEWLDEPLFPDEKNYPDTMRVEI